VKQRYYKITECNKYFFSGTRFQQQATKHRATKQQATGDHAAGRGEATMQHPKSDHAATAHFNSQTVSA
jgi:hypothetical protein